MATRLARTTTEFAVEWPVITRPTSFFSTLALPDSDGSVTAIEYSFDVVTYLIIDEPSPEGEGFAVD